MVDSIAAWQEIIEAIPDTFIQEYYVRTARRKSNGFPVNANEIYAEWLRLTDQRRWDEQLAPEKRGRY